VKISYTNWLWIKKISIKYSIPFDFVIGLFLLTSGLNPNYLIAGPIEIYSLDLTDTEKASRSFYCGISGIKFSEARKLGFQGSLTDLLKPWLNLKIFGLFLNSLSVNNIDTVLKEYKKISNLDSSILVKDIYAAAKRIGSLDYGR